MSNPIQAPGQDFPPFPSFPTSNTEPPNQSESILVSTSTSRLLLFADDVNSSRNTYVNDEINMPNPLTPCLLTQYDDGQPPWKYILTLRQYFTLVPDSYLRVYPGDALTKTYTTTYGVSTTDSDSLSAELGVSGEGLSAKLTATFGHSVTVSNQNTEDTKYEIAAPTSGVRLWMLWQLVNEIVALDKEENVIPVNTNRTGIVAIAIPGVPSLLGNFSAYLSYPNVQQAIPTQIYVPQQLDFPSVNPTK